MKAMFRMFSLMLAMTAMLGAPAYCQGDAKTSATKTPAPSAQQTWVRSEMYFGSRIPAGGQISKQQFAKFLDQVITKAFPEGLTVYETYGQMQEKDGKIVKQRTIVAEIIHEQSKAKTDLIKGIITSYRKQFGNPQALLLTSPTKPEFFTE
ncbi:MAG: DUF3574 domain-containing protein [bacterium]|nr:DUF3574 domain-containing protein [Candidatus Sumerlaeota bacterium]